MSIKTDPAFSPAQLPRRCARSKTLAQSRALCRNFASPITPKAALVTAFYSGFWLPSLDTLRNFFLAPTSEMFRLFFEGKRQDYGQPATSVG